MMHWWEAMLGIAVFLAALAVIAAIEGSVLGALLIFLLTSALAAFALYCREKSIEELRRVDAKYFRHLRE